MIDKNNTISNKIIDTKLMLPPWYKLRINYSSQSVLSIQNFLTDSKDFPTLKMCNLSSRIYQLINHQIVQSRLSWLHKLSNPTSSMSPARSSRAFAIRWEDPALLQSREIRSRLPSFLMLAT